MSLRWVIFQFNSPHRSHEFLLCFVPLKIKLESCLITISVVLLQDGRARKIEVKAPR